VPQSFGFVELFALSLVETLIMNSEKIIAEPALDTLLPTATKLLTSPISVARKIHK
jgi:hypothetical protein